MEYSVSESLNDANSSSGRRRHTGLKSHREDTLSVDRGFAQMEIRRRKEKDKMIQTSLYRKILEMEHNLEKCGKDLERTSDQTEKTRIDISKLIERKRYLEGELRHTRMTFSRRCAKFLAKYEWYYTVINRPQVSKTQVFVSSSSMLSILNEFREYISMLLGATLNT